MAPLRDDGALVLEHEALAGPAHDERPLEGRRQPEGDLDRGAEPAAEQAGGVPAVRGVQGASVALRDRDGLHAG